MEARAEAEMRRYDHAGMLKNLGGEGKPLPENHGHARSSGGSQSRIQQHVQRETLKK